MDGPIGDQHAHNIQKAPDLPGLHARSRAEGCGSGGGPGAPGGLPGICQPLGRAGANDPQDKSAVLHQSGPQKEEAVMTRLVKLVQIRTVQPLPVPVTIGAVEGGQDYVS